MALTGLSTAAVMLVAVPPVAADQNLVANPGTPVEATSLVLEGSNFCVAADPYGGPTVMLLTCQPSTPGTDKLTLIDAPDGTPNIFSLRFNHSGRCLTTSPSGGPVTAQTCTNGQLQQFTYWQVGAGADGPVMQVRTRQSERCLAAAGAATEQPVTANGCSNATGQRFVVKISEQGARFGVVGGAYGRCIDVASGNPADGAVIMHHDCHGGTNQQFTLPGDGTLRVIGKCLDAYGPAAPWGVGNRYAHLWACNGTEAQTWISRPDGTLYNEATGRCLDVPTPDNAARLYGGNCHGAPNQRWMLPTAKARFGVVGGAHAKCIDVASSNPGDGTAIVGHDCHGDANQQFTLPGDGTLRVFGRCLDAYGPAAPWGVGTHYAHLWTCNGSEAQTWISRPDGTLSQEATGKCLDLPTPDNAARLYTTSCHGRPNQQWALPVGGDW